MKNAKELLGEYIALLEKIIIDYNYNEDEAFKLLEKLKASLGEKQSVPDSEKELFEACTYNALATINTVLEQEKKSSQLLGALTEAKEEMKEISSML
ncbi:MAG: hypothetical protein IJX50_04320 [Clostridia bacterium]|nr:hypothetical protein [Clostridia bacterium]